MRTIKSFELKAIAGGTVTFLVNGKELEVIMTERNDSFEISQGFGIANSLTLYSDGNVEHTYKGIFSWFTNYKTDNYAISLIKTPGVLSHYKINVY